MAEARVGLALEASGAACWTIEYRRGSVETFDARACELAGLDLERSRARQGLVGLEQPADYGEMTVEQLVSRFTASLHAHRKHPKRAERELASAVAAAGSTDATCSTSTGNAWAASASGWATRAATDCV